MDIVSLLFCSPPPIIRPRFSIPLETSTKPRIAIVSTGGRSPRKTAALRPRISTSLMMQSSTSSSIPPGDALVLVPGDGVAAPSRWLAPFCAALDPERSVWLWFGDLPPSAPLPEAVLPALSAACSAAARAGKPMADFVPLVPRLAAQGEGKVCKVLGGGDDDDREDGEGEKAAFPSASPPPSLASVLVGSEEQREQASAIARRIERAQKSSPSSSVTVVVVEAEPRSGFPASLPVPAVVAAASPVATPQTTEASSDSPSLPFPPFDQVAVGGTFDRLHAGHRLLLAASALAAERRLFIGITGDKLLSKKKHSELLQPFEERAEAAVAFARKVRPGIGFEVDVGALLDPSEPTGAETERGMQALVVSRETIAGGEAINAGRKERGFRPLALLVVGLVGSSSEEGQGGKEEEELAGKISSTDLRAAEAAKKREKEDE